MQITSFTPLAQVTQSSKKAEPTEVAAAENKATETVNLDKVDKATQIMRNYDLHNISYPEVAKMGQELLDTGVITGLQFVDMVAPPSGHLTLVNGKTVIDPNPHVTYEKKDFLKDMELQLAYSEKYQASDISTVTHARSIVNILHNLDALHAQA